MNSWPRVPVSDLCNLIVDCVNKTAPSVDQETPYKMIRTTNIKNGRIHLTGCRSVSGDTFDKWTKRAKVLRGDILLTREAPMGEVGRVNFDESVFLGQRIVQYRTNPEKLTSEYLLYSFLSPDLQYQFRRHDSSGSTVSHIRVPDCLKFEIPLPTLSEQKKIAAVLSALDAKIDCNNRINAELEAMAKMLYDYWFVQFDFPDANGKPYKSSGGKMVYNATLKREIPAGWEDCELRNHIVFKRGISYKASDIQETGTPFINLNSFSLTGEFKIEGTKYFNGKFRNESQLDVGDLVIAITDVTRNADIIGKAFVIGDVFDKKPLISCDVAAVSSGSFGNFYLEQLFNSCHYHEYIKHFASGTLVLHLDLNGISWFKTVLPPQNVLDKYETHCLTLLKQREIVLKENLQLTQLRDWLLPMLMNGQVTVT